VSVRDWLTGPLHGWASDMIRSRTLVDWLGLPPGFADREWSHMLAEPARNARRIWALVMLASWAEAYARAPYAP